MSCEVSVDQVIPHVATVSDGVKGCETGFRAIHLPLGAQVISYLTQTKGSKVDLASKLQLVSAPIVCISPHISPHVMVFHHESHVTVFHRESHVTVFYH